MPITVIASQYESLLHEFDKEVLTVELVEDPPDAAKEAAASMCLGDCSLLESLVKIDLQDKEQRNSDTRQNDSDPAETPSPVLDIEDKSSGSLGTGKSRNHVWRGGKSKGQTSVPEIRRIGSEDANSINHASPSHRVEDLCSTEGGEVLRHSHEDKTKSCKATHEQEPLSASPDVEGLGHGDIAGCSHGV